MGTRNLIVAIVNNEYKIAQYSQWDGYPTGQGQGVVEFIINNLDRIDEIKKAISECEFISKNEIQKIQTIHQWEDYYPEFSRNTGSKIFGLIFYDEKRGLINRIDFANDSLFCEYAYVVDFDNEILEVYEGFNKTPLAKEDRFYNKISNEEKYKPVKLVEKYKFNELTKTTMEELEKELHEEN